MATFSALETFVGVWFVEFGSVVFAQIILDLCAIEVFQSTNACIREIVTSFAITAIGANREASTRYMNTLLK